MANKSRCKVYGKQQGCQPDRSAEKKLKEWQAKWQQLIFQWVTMLNLMLLNLTAGPDSDMEVWSSAWRHSQGAAKYRHLLLAFPLLPFHFFLCSPVLFNVRADEWPTVYYFHRHCRYGPTSPPSTTAFHRLFLTESILLYHTFFTPGFSSSFCSQLLSTLVIHLIALPGDDIHLMSSQTGCFVWSPGA